MSDRSQDFDQQIGSENAFPVVRVSNESNFYSKLLMPRQFFHVDFPPVPAGRSYSFFFSSQAQTLLRDIDSTSLLTLLGWAPNRINISQL